jgi:hypothetical protein
MLSLPVSLPRHLRNPGDDGYRTPTIEDAEHAERNLTSSGGFPFPVQHARSLTTADTDSTNPRFRLTVSDSHGEKFRAAGPGHLDLSGANWPMKLSWKQRIRHMTWAYFTLTMATGGIANVLYASEWFLYLILKQKRVVVDPLNKYHSNSEVLRLSEPSYFSLTSLYTS